MTGTNVDGQFLKLLRSVKGGDRLSQSSEDQLLDEVKSFLEVISHQGAKELAKAMDEYTDSENVSWFIRSLQLSYENKTGFSFLRMGDGEGRFVGRLRGYSAIQEFSLSIAQRIWFNYCDSIPGSDFFNELEQAYSKASCVGISPPYRLDLELDRLWYGYLGAVNGNEFIKSQSRGRFVKSWLGKFILNDDRFFRFLSDKKVVIISCHNAYGKFRDFFGCKDLEIKLIPPQGHPKLSDLTSGKVMYPDVFNNLKSYIETGQDKIFILGAGVYSKMLAEKVRKSGGIALDFGSILDYVAGIETRAR